MDYKVITRIDMFLAAGAGATQGSAGVPAGKIWIVDQGTLSVSATPGAALGGVSASLKVTTSAGVEIQRVAMLGLRLLAGVTTPPQSLACPTARLILRPTERLFITSSTDSGGAPAEQYSAWAAPVWEVDEHESRDIYSKILG